MNKGLLEINDADIISPVANGAYALLKYHDIELLGKNIVVIGKGKIAGKPLATLLSNKGATVTLCDKNTSNLAYFTQNADIIVSAVGKPQLITSDLIKDQAILISIGIKKINDQLFGDYDLDEIAIKASYASPTPGGAGPLTVAYLFINLIKCYKLVSILHKKNIN